ncbi:hypothetical protein GCK72_010376 [Caenorhabditis remanei]|uniref:Protein kinase domain-containing protein n=1 Tax=Caenorhabditis remanei TaxID=31234 RepID=A0A6A5H5T5_CAERE|nr:hypothetical protein GCK72_010376 [Caenorhabditis remanei]KAF1762114.1 hypothetical protein GCK72_010376 [Caenorhabditis remanei]
MANVSILDTTSATSLAPNVAFSRTTDSKVQPTTITESSGVPNLKASGFDCIRYMGTCNGGHIYLGRQQRRFKEFVAIKKFSIDEFDDYTAIARETAHLRLLSHQNIIELQESFVFEKSIYQITPAMNLGSLFDIVCEYKKWGINEKATAGITVQVLDALIYLHQKRYIHRDVKPKHILIDSKGNVKLTGFRFMIELNHHLDCVFDYDTHLQNQIYYLAPEVLAQNMHGYTAKSDIYMLGISICEAINGVMPFAELEPLEMLLRKLNGQVPRPVDKLSLQDDENMGIDITLRPQEHLTRQFSGEMHAFIANCLNYEPQQRSSASDLKDSDWLTMKNIKGVGPKELSQELQLDYSHFDLSLWEQEPVMPSEPEQKFETAFDYTSIS